MKFLDFYFITMYNGFTFIMEKNVKKSFKAIVLSLVMCIALVFCGCNLIETDMSVYLGKNVVTLDYGDKTVEIKVKEYLTAFNNYGAQLIQNGKTVDEAKDETINALIDRKVLVEEAKTKVNFENADYNRLWNETYDSLISNIKTYEEQVRDRWEITLSGDKEEESVESIKFEAYESKAYIDRDQEGNLVIKVRNNNIIEEDAEAYDIEDMQELIFEQHFESDNKLKKESLNLYIRNLKRNEEGLKLSTDNASVFKREVERIYNIYEENLYIEKLDNLYKYNDADGIEGDYESRVTVSQVLDVYKALASESNTLYNANKTTYNKDMLENFSNVNYVIDDNYFFVSHILLKFTAEQETLYKNLTSKYESGEITPAQYKAQLDDLYNSVGAIERDADGKTVMVDDGNGNMIEKRTNVNTFLTKLNNDMANITGTNVEQRKADLFNEYVYKHNEDPGIMNTDYCYVIGEEDSKMVETFTDASRELAENGEVGAISGIVRSTYGIHIIFYAGRVTNPFQIPSNTEFILDEEDIFKLTETRLSMFNTKTLFDKIYETLVSDNFEAFKAMELNTLKENIEITKHVSNYKN